MKTRKWILLAEDNANDATLALRALSAGDSPVEVVVAADGLEVLDCLYQREGFYGRDPGNPTLVLLDLKMPRLGGIEVLRRMKSDSRFHSIPVVMFTSSDEEADLVRSYQLGANAYVVKPLNYREFAAALRDVSNFWMLLNEPPPEHSMPDTAPRTETATAAV